MTYKDPKLRRNVSVYLDDIAGLDEIAKIIKQHEGTTLSQPNLLSRAILALKNDLKRQYGL